MAALVESFEQQSDRFCATFAEVELQQQETTIQQQQEEAEARVRESMQQLQAKRKQLAQQQAAVKELRQHVADAKATIKGEKVVFLQATAVAAAGFASAEGAVGGR